MFVESYQASPTDEFIVIPPRASMIMCAIFEAFMGIFLVGVLAALYPRFPLASICLLAVAAIWVMVFLMVTWDVMITLVICRSGTVYLVRPGHRLLRRGGVRIFHAGEDVDVVVQPVRGKKETRIQITPRTTKYLLRRLRVQVVTSEILPPWFEKYLYRKAEEVQ
jgi:hypothetical protein